MKVKKVNGARTGFHKSNLVVKSNIKSGPPIRVIPIPPV